MNTKKIVLCGLMSALVFISTLIIQIPVPATNGYINIGDSMIFVSSVLLGPIPGMIAGGFGSALADVVSGYSHWALPTLLIKGAEGFIVGFIIRNNYTLLKNVFATSMGAIIMVVGYFFAGAILYGSFAASLASVPSNLIQGVSSIVISILVSHTLVSNDYIKKYLI